MRVERYPENPLITPADVIPSRPDFEVICVFNAGVAQYNDEVILLLRVAEMATSDDNTFRVPILKCDAGAFGIVIREIARDDPLIDFSDPRAILLPEGPLLTSISHLRIARSRDGRHFTVDPTPAIMPDNEYEAYGVEDPRITQIGDTYYIAYKSVASIGISVSLAVTKDFIHFEKKGIIFPPENLDVCIFPEMINGRFAALHRPVPRYIGQPNMWVGYSTDLITWGDHRFMMGVTPGHWDSQRIGGGAIPVRTEHGWLEIYHGATADNRYGLGAVLLDIDEPHKVIARGQDPILVPEEEYEMGGFMPDVVFTCGAIVDGDTMHVYYGAADEVMAGADFSISELLDMLLSQENNQPK
ncbi:MAG: glycoside hydrolase family 130 protein [Armatimonadota bacterium]